MKNVEICPSILSANFFSLKEQIIGLEEEGAKILHFDVMDGHFVKKISFGTDFLKSIKSFCKMLVDVHLMVTNPLNFIEQFCEAGANSITFHIESEDYVLECIEKIKSFNCKCAIAINPETDVEILNPYLEFVDMVVIMSVVPGLGGQEFIKPVFKKIETLRSKNKLISIQVDGGVNLGNINEVVLKGANLVVVGSEIFKAEDVKKMFKELKKRLFAVRQF